MRGVVELRGCRSPEAGFAVEDVVEPIDHVGLGVADVEADPDPLGECVEDRQGRRGIELRTAIGGDEQRAEGKVDVRVRLGDQPGESGPIGGA